MATSSDFRQIYCSHNGINEADYVEHLLQKALPLHARVFRKFPLVTLLNKNFFRPDFDFVNDIGCLRHYSDYSQSVDEFHVDPWNKRTLLRGLLRLRVSTNRVRQIVREQLKTKAKTEAQPAVEQSSAPAILSAEPTAAAASPTDSILSEENKALIMARLEQIAPAPTPPSPELVSQTAHAPATSGQTATLQFTQRNARSRTGTLHHGHSQAAMEAEIDVLRVVNERLKCDLERITAQRDILKKAAAILAAP
ncbi:MAG: hypothetical protein H2172_10480 [Opitutus sp.]|nr:hypothetical protein [Opitutus sp.]MCS6247780.1 hypothetical protein [Opitutus sp.]MCS6274352.1 hypothetical protein [Opitutus sp.]MCS6276777.1 hypothetical protein [Opitutus sp.]MCS6301574.1 hypothetical protein [Opitutus sp.]